MRHPGRGAIRCRESLIADLHKFIREQKQIYGRTARDIMDAEVLTIEDSADIMDVVALMLERNVSRIPVLRVGRVVGMVSRTDILKVLLEFEEERYSRESIEEVTDDIIQKRVLDCIHGQLHVSPTALKLRVRDSDGEVQLRLLRRVCWPSTWNHLDFVQEAGGK